MVRRNHLLRSCLLLAMTVPVAMTGAVLADEISQDVARELRRAGSIQALDTLLEQVRERHPEARLLDAELERDDGRYLYEVEIVTRDGEVRELEIDAGSGEILEDEAED